ncbi:fumarylacetoacetate hydrolase family protein [Micromonospora sp. CPCC 206061]|uniref:fumarylacetoacetate hydrolase family protein n=1 Tax=Micromonospora sp. CPCC 206061 TaxID=3122410 RepID=UPI002FEF4860
MRIANHDGRLTVLVAGRGIDVERASGGRFAADMSTVYGRWDEFRDWWSRQSPSALMDFEVDPGLLRAPSPRPAQVFALGLNYAKHVAEGGLGGLPDAPVVFTKFPTSITGPYAEVILPKGNVDWEIELVAVVGRRTPGPVGVESGWEYVAGLTVGQDLSERIMQHRPPAPQFSLGKSFPGFAPLGPVLVTADEFDNPDDIALTCRLNGNTVQRDRTSSMIFAVPEIVAYLSGIVTLLPGDLIFTGTPEGVGRVRNPPVFIQPGDVLESEIENIGTIRQTFATAR